VEIETDAGTHIILDCGSGARELGQHLLSQAQGSGNGLRLHLFIGHTHWDHIQGFPFFVPAFLPNTDLNIYAAGSFQKSLEESLAGQMQYSYFPVRLRELRSHLHFTDLEEGFFRVGDVLVETQHLNHTAPTIAYRITGDGATIAYTTDHEPFWKPGRSHLQHPGDQRHIEFLRGADLVIHDAQYTDEEYPNRVGWGHSTVEYATDVCMAAEAHRLALFHHDPSRDDAAVDRLELASQSRVKAEGSPLEVFAAAEGMVIEIRGDKTAQPTPGVSAIRRHSISGKRVLLVGLDGAKAEEIGGELREENVNVLTAPDAGTAIDRIELMAPDLAVIAALSQSASDELIRDLRNRAHNGALPVLMLTGDPDAEANLLDVVSEATDYIAEPLSPPMVHARIRAWLARSSPEPVGLERIEPQAPPPVSEPERVAPAAPEGTRTLAEALAKVPLLSSLTAEQISLLAEHGTEHVFESGYTIIRQHETGNQVYVVLSGRVRVLEDSDELPRGETVIAELGTGEIFGEMAGLLDRPRSATVVAIEQTRCLSLPAVDFIGVLRASPDFAVSLLRVLAARIHETDRRLARYAPDALTGLLSRRAFYDQYSRIAAHARRVGRGATLIMLDIVSLRSTNDQFGYEAGDDALRTVADALSETGRKADLLARYGGDEFAVLLLDADPRSVDMILERVHRRLDDLVERRELPCAIQCAVGVAHAELLPDTPDELLLQADEDMQRRKRGAPKA
jgi:diguanylate cyclase (GGDEF)-like protein